MLEELASCLQITSVIALRGRVEMSDETCIFRATAVVLWSWCRMVRIFKSVLSAMAMHFVLATDLECTPESLRLYNGLTTLLQATATTNMAITRYTALLEETAY